MCNLGLGQSVPKRERERKEAGKSSIRIGQFFAGERIKKKKKWLETVLALPPYRRQKRSSVANRRGSSSSSGGKSAPLKID